MIILCYVLLFIVTWKHHYFIVTWKRELQKPKASEKCKMLCSKYRRLLKNWKQKRTQQILSISGLHNHWHPKSTPAYYTADAEATYLPRGLTINPKKLGSILSCQPPLIIQKQASW